MKLGMLSFFLEHACFKMAQASEIIESIDVAE